MSWYRVMDASAGQQVLIEAKSQEEATRLYLYEYPPDLMVEAVSQRVVDAWGSDPSDPMPY